MRKIIMNRTGIGVAVAVLAVLLIGWNVFSAKAGRSLQQSLIAKAGSQLNGNLQAGDIDVSILGWVKVRDVQVNDTTGAVVLKAPLFKFKWQFSDLWNGSLGVQSVNEVEVEQAEVWLQEKKDYWNIQRIIPDNQSETKFRGRVKLLDAKIHVKSATTSKTLDKVNGSINFSNYPDFLVDFQGMIGKSSIRVSGNWGNKDPGKFAITAEPDSLVAGLTIQHPLKIEAYRNEQQNSSLFSGSFQAPGMTVQDMNVTGISGKFRYVENRLVINQATGKAYGGAIAVDGEILADGQIELDLSGNGLDSSQLTEKDVQGPLSLTAHTSGRDQQYITKGKFTIYDGKAYGIDFRTLTGNFVKQGKSTETSNVAIQTVLGTFYPEQLSRDGLQNMQKSKIPTSQQDLEQSVKKNILNKLFR